MELHRRGQGRRRDGSCFVGTASDTESGVSLSRGDPYYRPDRRVSRCHRGLLSTTPSISQDGSGE